MRPSSASSPRSRLDAGSTGASSTGGASSSSPGPSGRRHGPARGLGLRGGGAHPVWPRRLAVVCAVLLVLVALGALAFAPAVRWAVDRKARALGLDVEVESVRAGLGTVDLVGVVMRPEAVDGVEVRLDRVRAWPSWTLGLGGVAAHGGVVRLDGPLSRLREAWRARAPRTASGGGASASRVPVVVDGVSVVWEGALEGDDGVQHVWGLSFAREQDGTETLGADLLRGGAFGSGAEVGGLQAVFRRGKDGGRVLSEVSARTVRAHVDVDRLVDAVLGRGEGGVAGLAATGAGLAAGGSESAHRGPRLRAGLGEVARLTSSLLEPGGKVELAGVRAEFRRGSELLNVGPARFTVQRSDDAVDAQLVPGGLRGSSKLTLGLGIPIGAGVVRMQLAGGPVSLAALGVREGDMGLVGVEQTRLDVQGRATLAADGSTLSLSGRYRLDGLALKHDKLAEDVIRGIAIGGRGAGEVALDGSHLVLDDVEVSVGRVRAAVSADIERGEGEAKGWARVSVPLASCQDLFDSTPRALLPDLAGMKLSGNFSFDGRVAFDTLRPADIDVTWKNQVACRITAVPQSVHPSRFERPWRRTVEDGSGGLVEILSGPGSPDWVPLYDISPHMETAITVCEDARFRYHEGFDHKAIADSIKDNVKAGRFVRGASTVTMQLAKNLYLTRDKTLSRKLQEAVLTVLLEQEFPKDRILELYLNVIEFGPGIYGIGRAAEHYFHVLPRELSLGQCLYLASILPNPKRDHFTDDGTLSDGWSEYIRRLMQIAHKIRRVSDDELEAGLAEEIRKGRYDPMDALDAEDGREPSLDRPDPHDGPDPFELFPGTAEP